MPQLISIQQRGEQQDEAGNWQAVVRINNGPENHVTVSNPFSDKKEEDELAWYFEEHLEFPFTNNVRASNAAKSITTYGEKLFKQVFEQNTKVAFAYRTAVQAGLSDVQIEIEGWPAFHALHWEALKDPELPEPLVLQATMVRKNIVPASIQSQVRPSPTINLLIVTARPRSERDIGYRTISRPLVEELRKTSVPIQIDILRPGTYRTLVNHLNDITARHGEGYYHVIHFDVHGSVLTYEQLKLGHQANRFTFNQRFARADIQPYQGVKAFLAFESEQEDNKSDLVEASELAGLLLKHHIPITILNACQSGMQVGASETSLGSQLMQAGVQLVLAMGYSVTVSAAELLMRTLYQKLFDNDDLKVAIRHARTELYNNKSRRAYFDQMIDLEDWLLPVVYQNQPVQLKPLEFTPEERSAYNKRKLAEKQYAPPEPQYGFVGRDLDILQIEKRLLSKRNLLLIRGMGGAGKTTLLKHLRAWWHTTGFVQQTFYFGYDGQAWTLQQILTIIAQQLYGPKYYTDIQPYPLDEQQVMIAERLRAEPHLLILDNLESITGAHLAIQHTLPKQEQDALRSFLSDLARGKTLVLLGSRGGEDWLARGTFENNRYDLGGLDPEAASTLADRILERNNARQYRDDEHLRRLIKLLDGFPLALEVVLANLKRQSPQELLEALQEGDVTLDIDKSQQKGKDLFQQKTESILRCIDYSHSNLSPDAQQLLLCLAPFTSVIWQDMLDRYTERLKKQPALEKLPFERWPEVIREAQNWGLLSPHEVPGFLRLQPTLTYFLRNRLNESGQVEMKQAIETAFREHYDQLGGTLYQWLNSKKPQERQIGQLLTGLEYENLVKALKLALEAQVSILESYRTLSHYLDATQDQRRGLELGQMVLRRLEGYSSEKLAGKLGAEFVGVIDDIAKRQLLLRLYKEAEASYQKALAIWLENKSYGADDIKKMSASIYYQLGMVAQEQRQWSQAEQYYQQALSIDAEFYDRYGQARTYHQLGKVTQEQRQWLQAEQYHQQALQIYIEFNDRYSQASIYHSLGIVAGEQRQWQQAEQYLQQALQIYIEVNDHFSHYSQASTYHSLGNIAQEQRQWQQAEYYYQQALQICIEFNDHYNQHRVYHELGILAQEQGQWQEAEYYYRQALQILIESNDRYSQAKTYHQLGAVAQEQRQWEQAEQYYQQALQILIESNDRYSQAKTYHQLGYVAQEQRQWQQAEQYYQQALQLKIEYNDRYSQASTYHQLGLLAQAQEHWQQAREYLLQALEIFGEYKDEYYMGMTLRNLARLWKASGDAGVPAGLARVAGVTVEEAEKMLREWLEEGEG
jgi:tetratricopeptide (TPR) repeat protein